MEEIQQSKLFFFMPLMAGYVVASLIGYYSFRKFGLIQKQEIQKTNDKFSALVNIFIAVAGIFIFGRLYTAGYLVQSKFSQFDWIINNFIIYSPIFLILIIKKQSTTTIWLSANKWYLKLAIGIASSIAAILVFLALRSEWNRFPEIVGELFSVSGLSYFPAIFLEGVALAFVFIRLKWAFKLKYAIAIPSLLFALAHIPRGISEGDLWWQMLLMSIVTGAITAFVLYICNKTKDIIWVGVVHYFLDVAIDAF